MHLPYHYCPARDSLPPEALPEFDSGLFYVLTVALCCGQIARRGSRGGWYTLTALRWGPFCACCPPCAVVEQPGGCFDLHWPVMAIKGLYMNQHGAGVF